VWGPSRFVLEDQPAFVGRYTRPTPGDKGWWVKAPLEPEAELEEAECAVSGKEPPPRRHPRLEGAPPARVYVCTRGHQQFSPQETWTSIALK